MSPRVRTAARALGGAGILALLVWQLGTGPFRDGLRLVDGWSLLAGIGISALTTWCCAWRWRLIAERLGVGVPIGAAVAAYYRSQFLNSTLPGGVLGDVHRALRHGRDAGDLARCARAVVWERSAGQVVQAALVVLALFVLPSPVRAHAPVAAGVLLAVLLVGLLCVRTVPTLRSDLRAAVLARPAWPGIALASAAVVAGHVLTFLVAARAAGSEASPAELVPLALLVLLAAGLPVNLAGWGPREGVAAWVFAAAGLGAAAGVTTAVVFGVMGLVASLPGAVVLAASVRPRGSPEPAGATGG